VATGKRYAGSAFAKYARYIHPDQFWNNNHQFPYFTSSTKIKRMVLEEGAQAFIVIRVKYCDDAKSYETRFLRKIKAATNDGWLNCHENDGNFKRTGPHSEETKRKQSLAKLGKKHTDIHRKRSGDARRGIPQTTKANKMRSDKMKGLPKRIITCPCCNSTGGEPQMKRWHFDNCKKKSSISMPQ
jgi:hypothetical protein